MEDVQNTELATGSETQTQQPVASSEPQKQDISLPQKETVPTEPRHPLQDVLDKAAKKAEEAQKQKVEADKTLAVKPAVEPAFDIAKWDGNANSLPDKLKKIVSDNQAAFTKKAQEATEFKQKFETLNAQVQQYLEQQKLQHAAQNPPFTKEEYDAAMLDPNKFLVLTQKVAQGIVDAEKAQLQPVISQIEFNQKVAENERVINKFAEVKKDFWELYDDGILEPLVTQYGLEEGYKRAADFKEKSSQRALAASQQRVQQKKSATTVAPTQPQQVEVVYVERQSEVLPMAAKLAAEGKKVKVRVRPN